MKKQIRIRCWITLDNERFFGPGKFELLQLIDQTGSISKAAKSMRMSYKKAWDMVTEMNSRSKRPYVVSHKGGEKGGGAEVTAAGKKMLHAYEKITKQLDAVVLKNRSVLKLF